MLRTAFGGSKESIGLVIGVLAGPPREDRPTLTSQVTTPIIAFCLQVVTICDTEEGRQTPSVET
ncbi:hypothetical protein ACQEU3_43440 [Spirillospora sp. CA-253888]